MKGVFFTFGLCYGGALISLFNPFVGLLVYVCFAIVKPEAMWFWSVPQGNYSRIVAVALLIGWVGKGFGNWRFGRASTIVVALVAYSLWALLAATWAIDPSKSWEFLEALAKIVLPCLVGITIIDSVAKIRLLAWVIALSQGYVALELNLTYFSGYNRLWEDGFAGMDNNSVAISLVTCTGLAFFLGLETPKLWLKGLALAAAAFMGHAILFSFSRGGMLALAVTGVVSFLILPKRPKHYLMFAIAALTVISLAGPQVVARFSTTFAGEEARDSSAQSRLELWSACWDLMTKHPLGIGPDQFGMFVHEYGFQPGKQAHSLWMQQGAEVGFMGLGCLLSFYGLCIVRLWPLTRERCLVPDPWLRTASRMVISSLVGFAVSAQFVSLTTLEAPYYIAMVGAAVLKLCSSWTDSATPLSDYTVEQAVV
jgi:probable O-glycosylation ligase (exosortase A-associated)